MSSELIINVTYQETRVALMENGVLAEIYIERNSDQGIVGSIYKGKVVRVLPGMQAAFVDIGLARSAFLHVADIYDDFEEIESLMNGQGESGDVPFGTKEEQMNRQNYIPQIEDLLHEGQEILVQVSKEPIGSKGARITSHISLPGRHLVLMPTVNHVGVSRRIENDAERKRLKEMIGRVKPGGMGYIARTASEGKSEEELRMDLEFLQKLWNNIQRKKATAPVPGLVHNELSMSLRAIRDLYTHEVERVVIDSQEEYESILEFIETFIPQLRHYITLYDREEPIFDAYGIEEEINRALGKRVWLKSGGYIVIEENEALVAIDVNTGRYVGKRNYEDTILRTNLEAAKEIAYQLRLRNIGGIIIIDFIDMEKEWAQERVLQALKESLKKDRAKTNILRMSELGLVEMTRKRNRESLAGTLGEACPYCDGKGFIKSKYTMCYEVFQEIKREALNNSGGKVIAQVHPDIAELLYDEERGGIEDLEQKLRKKIVVRANPAFHHEEFEVSVVER
jgi:ribonuclease G